MLTAQNVKTRFITEQEYILRFVEFLHSTSAIRESDLSKLDNTLRIVGLPDIPKREDWRKWREPYSAEELTSLVNVLQRNLPQLNEKITELEKHLEQLPEPEGLSNIDARL